MYVPTVIFRPFLRLDWCRPKRGR